MSQCRLVAIPVQPSSLGRGGVAAESGEYRVDELARAAGTTVRNVRAYQDRGLLPPPRRDGRVGWYGEVHLLRLRLISSLLSRGFTLANIAELLDGWSDGRTLGDLVGFGAQITGGPFTDEVPDIGPAAEIVRRYGVPSDDPAIEARLLQFGLIEKDGDQLRVPSPRLLRAGVELYDSGVPLDAILAELVRLRRDVAAIARRFVDLVGTSVVEPRIAHGVPKGPEADALVEMIRRLRPLATTVVTSELARALQTSSEESFGEHLARLVAAGPPAVSVDTGERGR
jgi:DNA-binding transcriptional MerR regulator